MEDSWSDSFGSFFMIFIKYIPCMDNLFAFLCPTHAQQSEESILAILAPNNVSAKNTDKQLILQTPEKITLEKKRQELQRKITILYQQRQIVQRSKPLHLSTTSQLRCKL